MIQKGDIFYIRHYNSSPKRSGRPAVVLSGETTNKENDSVIVAFLSNRPNAILESSSVPIKSMGNHSLAVTSKLSTISKDRLSRRAGHVTLEELARLESALCRVLEL